VPASIILAHEGEKERAVELMGLAFNRSVQYTGWMDKWPLLTRLRAQLQNDLGTEAYSAAWERGKSLDLKIVVTELLERWQLEPDSSQSVSNQQSIDQLTERELDVLRLVAEGRSNRQIARELFITVGTVKTHVHRIYSKLGVENRFQAAALARELHLLS
jgi:DNA-binding NarL/FixJ family response regulator